MQDTEKHTAALVDYVDLRELHAVSGVHNIFPSLGSLQWFVRQHRAALADSGALISITGRLKFHPHLFAQAAVEIGKRTAGCGSRSGESHA